MSDTVRKLSVETELKEKIEAMTSQGMSFNNNGTNVSEE